MKKQTVRPIEHACAACHGTGVAPAKPPSRAGVRIYPPSCKECQGKGKVAD